MATAVLLVVVAGGLGFGAWQLSQQPPSIAARLPSPPSAEITLRLKATPANGKIVIDDGTAAGGPLTMQVARDGRDHHVRFEADGFVPRTEVVGFRDDLAKFIALAPVDTAAPATGAPDAGTK